MYQVVIFFLKTFISRIMKSSILTILVVYDSKSWPTLLVGRLQLLKTLLCLRLCLIVLKTLHFEDLAYLRLRDAFKKKMDLRKLSQKVGGGLEQIPKFVVCEIGT